MSNILGCIDFAEIEIIQKIKDNQNEHIVNYYDI